MKKNFLFLFCLITILTVFVNCGKKNGNNDETIELNPESTNVKGDLRDCFEVVDRVYKTDNSWGTCLNVELRRKSDKLPESFKGCNSVGKGVMVGNILEAHVRVNIIVELLDADGNIIEKSTTDDWDNSEQCSDLFKLAIGESGTVKVSFRSLNEQIKNASKFRVSSTATYIEKEELSIQNVANTESIDNDSSKSNDEDLSKNNKISISDLQKGELIPQKTTITGDLGDCFEVVDMVYRMNNDDVTVQFKRVSDKLPASFKGCTNIVGWGVSCTTESYVKADLTIEYLDESGNIIGKYDAGDYSHESIPALFSLKKGESGSAQFSSYSTDDVQNKAKQFRITSKSEYNKH